MLCERGHTVHATTRSAGKAAYLKAACPGVKIFPGCDLLKEGSFDAAIRGCSAVLHTASPFFFAGGTEEKLIKPALEGTRNVLSSCERLGVKRVILTSSTAAVYAGYGKWDKDHVYTEADWSPEDKMLENSNFYCLSKTRAERLAWKMAKEAGCSFKLAVMNPTLIWGPQLPKQPHFNTSCAILAKFIDGSSKELPAGSKAVVDVRDVAEAHVVAAEDTACLKGCWGERTLLIAGSAEWVTISKVMRSVLPEKLRPNVPTRVSTTVGSQTLGAPAPHPTLFDGRRAEALLGRKLRSTSTMVEGSVISMLDNGFSHSSQYVPGK